MLLLCFPLRGTGSGRMNTSVREVMFTVGKALNDTFKNHVAIVSDASGSCGDGVAVVDHVGGKPFDYIVTREDLSQGTFFVCYPRFHPGIPNQAFQQ